MTIGVHISLGTSDVLLSTMDMTSFQSGMLSEVCKSPTLIGPIVLSQVITTLHFPKIPLNHSDHPSMYPLRVSYPFSLLPHFLQCRDSLSSYCQLCGTCRRVLKDYAIIDFRAILFHQHFHLSNPTSHLSSTYICFLFCSLFLSFFLVVYVTLIESSTSQVVITHTIRGRIIHYFTPLGYHYYGPSSG